MKKIPVLPPRLLEISRGLRREQTAAEEKLWRLLRGRQLGGYKFRRQHAIANPETVGAYGNYILDFYCHEKLLAIELDGGGHTETEQAAYDANRTRALETLGIAELRFWNSEISENLEYALEAIWNKLHE